MRDVTVVMLGHKSLAGKDTAYDFVKGMGFVRAAFADKLKSTVADLYGFSDYQMFSAGKDVPDLRYRNTVDPEYFYPGDSKYPDIELNSREKVEAKLRVNIGLNTKKGIRNPEYTEYFTPRRILQIFGQQQRLLSPDIWASYVFDTTIPNLVEQGHSKIIITDFRFKNEAEVAKRWGSKPGNKLLMFKVHRPGVVAKSGANDESEHDLNNFSGWDNVIDNEGSLDLFKSRVIPIFSAI